MTALAMAAEWGQPYGDRLRVVGGTFSNLDTLAGEALDGVVLDLGVSSMQLDQAERGFSFTRDGPLDMRMSQSGPSAADLVNTAAEGQLASLRAQLDNIKDKTVTVTVNTVNAGAAPAAPDDLPARAYGGVLPGWAPHDRADNMIYRGTPGEWVMQRRAVRYYGPDFMAALNAMRLPKYANGGLLGNLRMPSISSAPPAAPASSATFNFPGMGSYPVSMAPDVLGELQSAFAREALKKGARR